MRTPQRRCFANFAPKHTTTGRLSARRRPSRPQHQEARPIPVEALPAALQLLRFAHASRCMLLRTLQQMFVIAYDSDAALHAPVRDHVVMLLFDQQLAERLRALFQAECAARSLPAAAVAARLPARLRPNTAGAARADDPLHGARATWMGAVRAELQAQRAVECNELLGVLLLAEYAPICRVESICSFAAEQDSGPNGARRLSRLVHTLAPTLVDPSAATEGASATAVALRARGEQLAALVLIAALLGELRRCLQLSREARPRAIGRRRCRCSLSCSAAGPPRKEWRGQRATFRLDSVLVEHVDAAAQLVTVRRLDHDARAGGDVIETMGTAEVQLLGVGDCLASLTADAEVSCGATATGGAALGTVLLAWCAVKLWSAPAEGVIPLSDRLATCGASLGGLTWPVTLLRSAGFRADEPPHADTLARAAAGGGAGLLARHAAARSGRSPQAAEPPTPRELGVGRRRRLGGRLAHLARLIPGERGAAAVARGSSGREPISLQPGVGRVRRAGAHRRTAARCAPAHTRARVEAAAVGELAATRTSCGPLRRQRFGDANLGDGRGARHAITATGGAPRAAVAAAARRRRDAGGARWTCSPRTARTHSGGEGLVNACAVARADRASSRVRAT